MERSTPTPSRHVTVPPGASVASPTRRLAPPATSTTAALAKDPPSTSSTLASTLSTRLVSLRTLTPRFGASHLHSPQEFEGRATWGKNFIEGSEDTDENGHGTHCAGTIAGASYGVASKANLVAVKVLDAEGSGSNSGVIGGIDFVGQNAKENSVLSMSLGGSKSEALNSAVESTISAGVTVVVAAGNDNADAADYSPASAKNAITVGATDDADNRAEFSNYGAVLDVFAPGVDIKSAWIGGKSASNTISGTSMATPHVAGLAAYLIGLGGLSSPADVAEKIQSLAISGAVQDPKSTNNLLAYNGNDA